jgi:sulfur carrier protein ThiS
VQLYLGGHLNWYDPQKRRSLIIPLKEPTQLTDMLGLLQVPLSEVAVGTLNDKPLFSFEHVILTDADTVRLYPPVDGG